TPPPHAPGRVAPSRGPRPQATWEASPRSPPTTWSNPPLIPTAAASSAPTEPATDPAGARSATSANQPGRASTASPSTGTGPTRPAPASPPPAPPPHTSPQGAKHPTTTGAAETPKWNRPGRDGPLSSRSRTNARAGVPGGRCRRRRDPRRRFISGAVPFQVPFRGGELVPARPERGLEAGVGVQLGPGDVFQPAADIHVAGAVRIGHLDAVCAHAHGECPVLFQLLRGGQGSSRAGGGHLVLACPGGGPVLGGVLLLLLTHPLAYGAGAAGGGIRDADAVLAQAPEEGAVAAAGGARAGAAAAVRGGDGGVGGFAAAGGQRQPADQDGYSKHSSHDG